MKKLLCLSIILFCALPSFCQYYSDKKENKEDKFKPFASLGFGLGLDYGGIGGRLTFIPIKQVAVFAAVGYNFVGVGYNFGALYHFMPTRRVCPYLGGMYGYNGVIKVVGLSEFDKIYYGPTITGGIELHAKRNRNYFSFGIGIPFRSQQFNDDWDKIKQNPNVKVTSEPVPVTISVGYHLAID